MNKYVICTEQRYDNESKYQLKFASKHPKKPKYCWRPFGNTVCYFNSPEDARKWWEKNKKSLTGSNSIIDSRAGIRLDEQTGEDCFELVELLN